VIGLFASALAVLIAGCDPKTGVPEPGAQQAPVPKVTVVRTVRPERKTVRQSIEQPGFNIEAFQETPLYARVTGYVRKWNVDIGDRVRKDEVLAELAVPEMAVELGQREAAVRQAVARVGQARAAGLVARAQVERAKSQYERLVKVGQGGVLDRDSIDEARLGFEAAKAGVEKTAADVAAAEAEVEVATANRDYAKTMLDYRQIRSPYDGVVTKRNANNGDFVQPAATGPKGQPLFVVSQLDPVRVFINVPGADAARVKDGDPVSLRLQGAGEPLQGHVTRNARALDPLARTLRTEIDVPNPEGKLLPGMYVQAVLTVQHIGTWTLPPAAILTEGDQTFCYRVEDAKAVRTALQIGLRGSGVVEVLKKQERPHSPGEDGRWSAITGEELVVTSDAASLSDGQPLRQATGEE
jgi:RND family efflux transporter MFP subunit